MSRSQVSKGIWGWSEVGNQLWKPGEEGSLGMEWSGKSGLEARCGQGAAVAKGGGVGNVGHVAVGRGGLVTVTDLGRCGVACVVQPLLLHSQKENEVKLNKAK